MVIFQPKWQGDNTPASDNVIPPEICENPNLAAWYMYHYLGMTLAEIGWELGYSDEGARKIIQNTFQRQSTANIYKKHLEYCKDECKSSTSECRSCNLYLFIVKKMVKKRA